MIACIFHGGLHGFNMVYYGFTMVLLWFYYSFTMVYYGLSYGWVVSVGYRRLCWKELKIQKKYKNNTTWKYKIRTAGCRKYNMLFLHFFCNLGFSSESEHGICLFFSYFVFLRFWIRIFFVFFLYFVFSRFWVCIFFLYFVFLRFWILIFFLFF